ncbi:hypothetical protein EC917_101329 [Bacillus thuringiensis]|uniref:Uncharacterized protein n=1 Tax=Bacillus thuringiensis TaxID=1428 RepID=A0A4R4BLR2_BACTU|nr:hypothetical protein [Bacillus thuringiensis]TCW59075.1 hypothetical protein EC917_101329 [Bacillus thuringiensis]TCW59685.1 hypothetical protein EC910_101315 [Bacillus thuringiensis]
MFSPKLVNTILAIMWASAITSLGISIYDLNTPRIIGNIGNLLIVVGITIVLRNGCTNRLAVMVFTVGPVFAALAAAIYMMHAEYYKVGAELVTFAMAFFYMKLFYVKNEE